MNRRKFLIGSGVSIITLAGLASYWHNRWKYIVIHHSAGTFGNIDFLQKVHRNRQANDPIDAIPYHYIVGNGKGLALGDVDSDWRQAYGIWGAHVSSNNSDRNMRGIGICMIGNFEQHSVPEPQYQALLSLVRKLMQQHAIPPSHVSGHGHIKGESTLCPGKHFPMSRLLKEIAV